MKGQYSGGQRSEVDIQECNAIIESTMLGIEDHGMITCFLHLNYGGSGQGFGGYSLESMDSKGITFIRKILETVGVDKWEQLKGKYVRARWEHNKCHAIGHIIEDKWFSPEEFYKGVK